MRKSFLLLMWLAACYAYAQDEGHVRFLKFQADYRVNPDATYSVVRETAYRLLTESALVSSGKMPINYSSKLEEVEILEAYTMKKDGRRIDVGSAGIQTQQGKLAAGYGISRIDQRTLMITFPQLEVGDTVAYKYRLVQKEPIFPDQFYAASVFARGFAWDAVDISIDMPASLMLQVQAMQIQGLPIIEQNGRRLHRWYARNLPIIQSEPGSVDAFHTTPHLVASTFKDWGQFAAAYQARAGAKAAVTPAIAQMAEQITQNVTDPRGQAKLIYDWVSKNVRYVATWIGAGGWVPHDAETVLNNRYGDCKDHVVLLQALLTSKGIASTPVLIVNDHSSYTLPSVVYPAFNHVIAYLPTLNIYIDSTAGSILPFGILPLGNADKPVVHTASYDGIRRTPKPAQYTANRLTRMTLAEDGSAMIESHITAGGVAAIELRELQRSIGRNKEAEWVHDFLNGKNLEGKGNVSFEESADGTFITMRLTARINDFLVIAENGTIPLSPLLVGPIAFDTLSAIHKRPTRLLPYWCPAWTLDDQYEIRVPRNMRLILPKGKMITEAGFSYVSRYAVQDRLLTARRRLSIDRSTVVCAPAEYAAGKSALSRIERDLRAQIIYQATEKSDKQSRQ